MKFPSSVALATLVIAALTGSSPSLPIPFGANAAKIDVLPCVISPYLPIHLHGDFATYAFPELAEKYWPDLNVSRMVVVGSWDDENAFDVARSYIKDEGGTRCNLVIGPGFSNGCVAISPLIGKPLWVEFSATSTQLSSKSQFPNFLRVVSTDAQGGVVIANLLKTLGWKNVFVFKSDDVYGNTYSTGVTTEHALNGGSVVHTFSLLSDAWSTETFISILMQVRSQQRASRALVVVGIDVAKLLVAVEKIRSENNIHIDDEITFIFGDYACSAGSPWNSFRNAFCVAVDQDEARWSDFVERYINRDDANYTISREELFRAGYPKNVTDSYRNEVGSYHALAVDAVFYGLTVLQQYQASHDGELPEDSVPAASYAINSGISFPEGLSGGVGVDANGDRATFISAVKNTDAQGTIRTVSRDIGNGKPLNFTETVYIGSKSYDLLHKTPAEIAATVPSDRILGVFSDSGGLDAYVWVIIALVIAAVIGLGLVAGNAIYRRHRRGETTKHAPKVEAEPAALIFTDIESSTALWAECPQQMVTALELHNAVIRNCIAEYRGYEVKTIGDSFMIAFKSAVDAVNFSLAMQKDLYAADWSDEEGSTKNKINLFYEEQHAGQAGAGDAQLWNGLRVRIGGHFGFVSIRRVVPTADTVVDSGTPYDYFGSTVNVAARVESIGHGGQVLFTKALVDAYDADLAFDGRKSVFVRTSMGPVELRGYNEPVNIIQFSEDPFDRRVFNELRIEKADMEGHYEDDGDAANINNNNNGLIAVNNNDETRSVLDRINGTENSKSSNFVVDLNTLVQNFATRRKLKEEEVRFGYLAVDALTNIMKPSEQSRLIHSLLTTWRVGDAEIRNVVDELGGGGGAAAAPPKKENLTPLKLLLASRVGPVGTVREGKLFGANTITAVASAGSDRKRSFKNVRSQDGSATFGTSTDNILIVDEPTNIGRGGAIVTSVHAESEVAPTIQ